MQDPSYPLFPVLFFLSFILVLIPLPWHLQAWNVGTVMYIVWTALACLNQFINSVVWRDDAIIRIPAFCDISIRFIVASSIAIPAASLTISRRLYKISRVQTVISSPKEKRREMIVDLSICLGLPLFITIIWWFVQGHRFDIVEQLGCSPATFNTPLAYVLIWSWPLILGTISMIYCSMTIFSFLKRRREMSQFLSSNSMISFSRYFRLMTLASMDAFLTVPLGIFAIWLNSQEGVQPWRGLADAHWGFDRVDQVPAVLWRLNYFARVSFYINRVFIVVCALVFFAFFGFAEESRRNYARLFWRVAARFGYAPPEKDATMMSLGSSSMMMRTPELPVMSALSTSTIAANDKGGDAMDFDKFEFGGTKGLKVFVDQDYKYKHQSKRASFVSSVGDLSSSFTVDLEDQKGVTSPTETTSSDSLPNSPITEMEMRLDTLPRLTANSPPPFVILPPQQPRPRSTTPSRPPTRPDTMDFDV